MSGFLLNWVLSSTLLIAVVILLRALFGRRISARLRYALWAVVLARLLIPGQFFTAPIETPFPSAPTVQMLPTAIRTPAANLPRPEEPQPAAPVQTIPVPDAGTPDAAAPEAPKALDPLTLLAAFWLAGTAGAALLMFWSNLRFSRQLKRVRTALAAGESPLPVYAAPGLPSPCLCGVLHPAVYVTPEAAADPAMFRHVLTHEVTHYRHGDHVWSLLRCAALAVHWWNPLVWLAVVLSRRDAELACDEGALKRLGDGERQAYGSTLLALVTARPQPGDLLRCATTMAGDKRSLRERVSRIARTPKRWLWAAVLAAALSVLVCACAFAKTAPRHEDRPLTQEELDALNSTVFNGPGFNMMNQLAFLAVEAPKDYKQIDLFQLFYNGAGEFESYTEEERQAAADAAMDGEDPGIDLVKCTASEMDAVLQKYLGLSLEETDKWGLDQFVYLPEYDAYYHFCGDTNYIGDITFTSGEWKDNKLLLYYEGNGYPVLSDGEGGFIPWEGTQTACLTLEEQADGGYRFLSNWRSTPPAVPPAYPSWDPELVIPLDGLAPYRTEPLTIERRTGDVAESLYRTRFEPDEFSDEGFDVEVYRSTDGRLYAAVAVSETERDCFFTIPGDSGSPVTNFAANFTDLFGHNGVVISYYGSLDENYYGEFSDYFTFTDDGKPSLLLQARGEPAVIDLDGDGVDELTSGAGDTSDLFFQRDGQLYQAEVHTLVQEAWPEAGYMNFGYWDRETRSMGCGIEVPMSGTDFTVTAYRDIYFDGKSLRLYLPGYLLDGKSLPPYKGDGDGRIDHDSLKALPEDVLAAARDFVQGQFDALSAKGYGTDGSGKYDEGNFGPGNVVWDDWRLTELRGPYYEAAGPVRVEIWNVGYETHTTTPDRVVLAGGSYMGEDGWCMIGYPVCDYLYFQLDENGNRTYLFSEMENDCSPGTEMFLSDMVNTLMDRGILTLTDLDGEVLAKMMSPNSSEFLNSLAERSEAERDEILMFLAGYLCGGSEEGETYYEDFRRELNGGGYRAEALSEGGRAAWEELQGIINHFQDHRTPPGGWDAALESVPTMTLPELFDFLESSDGAYTEGGMEELLKRFQTDPEAVLSALAEHYEQAEQMRKTWLLTQLGHALYWNEDLVPGALEHAWSLDLKGQPSAMLEYITTAYEAKRQEQEDTIQP